MFRAKYDYSCRLNSQIQSICKCIVEMWHRENKAIADVRIDEQQKVQYSKGPENNNLLLSWKLGKEFIMI